MSWIKNIWNSTVERRWVTWLVKLLWLGAIIGVIASGIIFFLVSRTDLPTFEDLENPQYDLASIIYDTNGEAFGKYYIENREFITFKDLSPNIYNCLLYTSPSPRDQRGSRMPSSA